MIGCVYMKSNYNDYISKKVSVYLENFTPEELSKYEDEIFTEKMDKRIRAELEFYRLKDEISIKDSKYYLEIRKLSNLFKIANLGSDIVDEIYKIIVEIQLANNMDVRLYSALNLIKNENEIKELKKKVGEYDNGRTINR